MSNQNSEELFIEYYHQYKQSLYNYFLYRVAFKQEIAEDLLSETFLKAFKHFKRFDRERSFKTWVYTIAHNLLVNHYRSSKPTCDIDDVAEPSAKEQLISEVLDIDIDIEKIKYHLDDFPPKQKEMLILRYINDLSYEEISKIMQKEEGAIRVGVSRAIKKLKEKLNTV